MAPQEDLPLRGVPPLADARAPKLVLASALLNAAILPAAVLIYLATSSQLVLAQGADSLLDVVVGGILLYSLRVARQPRDEDHPFGHQRAEPIGAIVAAVLAGALGFEVLRSGISALVAGRGADLHVSVVVLLGAKLAFKLGLLVWIGRAPQTGSVEAARVDARNDVAACASSIAGYLLARQGLGWADAALSLPVGLYIGYNGVELARENIRYLMGEAPPREILEALERAALEVAGVLEVTELRAQHLGPSLHVTISVLVADARSATEGHDIAVAVQRKLERYPFVAEVFVHVDTEEGVAHA